MVISMLAAPASRFVMCRSGSLTEMAFAAVAALSWHQQRRTADDLKPVTLHSDFLCRRHRWADLSCAAAASDRDGGGSAEMTDSGACESDSLAAVSDRLSLAIAAEDYGLAAQLRDELG